MRSPSCTTHTCTLLLRYESFGSQLVSGSGKLWLLKATTDMFPPTELEMAGEWTVQLGHSGCYPGARGKGEISACLHLT